MVDLVTIADQVGSSFLVALNAALQALAGCFVGATPPATTYAGQFWLDTGTSIDATGGPWLRQRNSGNSAWIRRAHGDNDLVLALMAQSYTNYTTGGTSTAFTLTPSPAIAANVTGHRFRVTFNAAAGATPTLSISGKTALNLKYKDSTGTKQAITAAQVPSGWTSDVENDGTDFVVLDPADRATVGRPNTWGAGQSGALVTLTDGATITPDFSLGNNFQCQLGGSRTLANPTNIKEGQSGIFRWIQDATGGRALSYGWMYSAFGGSLPTLSTSPGYHDRMGYAVDHYATSTVTISIATPGVVSWTGHGCSEGDKIQFTTTGALPTGLTASTTYYIKYVDANSFQLAATRGGAAIATSGTQSGVHTAVSAEIGLTLGSNLS